MKQYRFFLRSKLVLLLFASFCFGSCDEPPKKDVIYKTSIQPKYIDTGNSLGQFYFFNQVRNDSLFLFNVFSHSLEIVDLKVDSIIHSFKFEFNGLNAVNDISSFYFHNKDSIFLAEENSSIVLVNGKGEIKKRYTDFGSSFEANERAKLYDNLPSFRYTSQLIFNPAQDELLLYFMSFDQPEKRRILASYSLESGESRSLPIYYPEMYQGWRLDLSKLFLTSATMDREGFTYTFSGSPIVYRYSYSENKVTSVEANPPWKKTVADPIPFGEMSTEQKQAFMADNPFYYKIYFDPYRNLYYRLSSPPRPNSPEPDFHYVKYNTICLTVLDKDLQVLDHLFLPKENVYNVGFSFVTSEGLWISYTATNQDDESWIKGDLIKLEKVLP
jgi:hypothetical protein